MLKPGQSLSSYVGEHSLYHDKVYQVTTSWKHHPADRQRQSLSYDLSMGDYEGYGHLGSRSPRIQIAEQVKQLREDWRHVASGSRKLSTDIYTSEDRAEEQRQWEEYREQAAGRREEVQKKKEPD